MLLIACPWCGPRDETEFACGGEAHIARPVDPTRSPTRSGRDYLFMRKNPQGRASRALGAHARLPALVQRAARHRHVRDHRRLQGRRAAAFDGSDAGTTSNDDRHQSPAGRRPHRPRAHVRSRSTARRLPGHRGRHARLGAARERRPLGRAQLQIPPPARHPRGRRRRAERARAARNRGAHRAERARHRGRALRRARRAERQIAGRALELRSRRRERLARPRFLPAGFYYKTFMWPAGFWMRYEHFIRRAAGLGARRRARSRSLRQC